MFPSLCLCCPGHPLDGHPPPAGLDLIGHVAQRRPHNLSDEGRKVPPEGTGPLHALVILRIIYIFKMQIIGNYLSSLAKCMQSNSRVLKMSVTGLKGGPRCRGAATVTAGNGMSLIPDTFQYFELMEEKLF